LSKLCVLFSFSISKRYIKPRLTFTGYNVSSTQEFEIPHFPMFFDGSFHDVKSRRLCIMKIETEIRSMRNYIYIYIVIIFYFIEVIFISSGEKNKFFIWWLECCCALYIIALLCVIHICSWVLYLEFIVLCFCRGLKFLLHRIQRPCPQTTTFLDKHVSWIRYYLYQFLEISLLEL